MMDLITNLALAWDKIFGIHAIDPAPSKNAARADGAGGKGGSAPPMAQGYIAPDTKAEKAAGMAAITAIYKADDMPQFRAQPIAGFGKAVGGKAKKRRVQVLLYSPRVAIGPDFQAARVHMPSEFRIDSHVLPNKSGMTITIPQIKILSKVMRSNEHSATEAPNPIDPYIITMDNFNHHSGIEAYSEKRKSSRYIGDGDELEPDEAVRLGLIAGQTGEYWWQPDFSFPSGNPTDMGFVEFFKWLWNSLGSGAADRYLNSHFSFFTFTTDYHDFGGGRIAVRNILQLGCWRKWEDQASGAEVAFVKLWKAARSLAS